MILTRRKLTRRKLTRMKINNATFQIKLTRTAQGIFKTHKINANDMRQVFFLLTEQSKLTKYKLAVLIIVCINVTSMDLNYPQLNLIKSLARRP